MMNDITPDTLMRMGFEQTFMDTFALGFTKGELYVEIVDIPTPSTNLFIGSGPAIPVAAINDLVGAVIDHVLNVTLPKCCQLSRQLQVFKATVDTARAVSEAIKAIPRHKLPRIATAARRRRSAALAKVCITGIMGVARVSTISMQPLPCSTPGTDTSSGSIAIIGDRL